MLVSVEQSSFLLFFVETHWYFSWIKDIAPKLAGDLFLPRIHCQLVKPRSPAAQGSRLSLPTGTWLPLFHRLCGCEKKKLANWIVLLKTVVFSLDSWIKEFTPKLEGDLFHQKKLARRVYLFMIFFKMKISLNK